MLTAGLMPELRERIARSVLSIAAPVVLGGAVFAIVVVHLTGPGRSVVPGITAGIGALVAMLFGRAGHGRAGTALLTVALFAAIATSMWFNGGVLAPGYLVTAALVVLVAVVHGRAWALAFVTLTIGLGGTFVFAQAHGLIGPPPVLRPVLEWAGISMATGMAAMFAIIPIVLLRQTLRELERANEEQTQFAHISAHDLQEPTRMIAIYLQLIEREAGERLDARLRERFDVVIANAKRLQRMVASVLDYTETAPEPPVARAVDTDAALQRAIAELRGEIAGSGAEIEAQPLPPVLGDEALISRLFQCLLSNAIKFRAQEPPRITVSAERAHRGWIFSVGDNGIGIDPAEHDRLFRIFGRLNHRDDYPGEGVGLAICKKIVAQRRGRIWAEPNPGGGTLLRFSVPDTPPRGALAGGGSHHPLPRRQPRA
jgi:signal transduction histidine kinase